MCLLLVVLRALSMRPSRLSYNAFSTCMLRLTGAQANPNPNPATLHLGRCVQ